MHTMQTLRVHAIKRNVEALCGSEGDRLSGLTGASMCTDAGPKQDSMQTTVCSHSVVHMPHTNSRLRHHQAYDEIGVPCPEVFDLLYTIAKAAVDNHLTYSTFMFSPSTEAIDKILAYAQVPDLQRPAAGRVLNTLAACDSSGKRAPKRRKMTAKAPRSDALNAYHQAAQGEIQRLNPPAIFTLANGRRKTVPGVKKNL